MSKCKVCGFRLSDLMKKCPMCGAVRGSLVAGEINKNVNLLKYSCPSCKAEIIGEHRFCPACRKELSEVAKNITNVKDSTNIMKLLTDYQKLKKKMFAWRVLAVVLLATCIFIFLWNQKKEEHNTKQEFITETVTPIVGNVSGNAKETPLEAFKYEVHYGKYILKGLKDTTLTNIVIPKVFSEIGDMAFENYFNLTSVTIPNSVTKIGDKAFKNCSGLTNIAIPNSVTKISFMAFLDCHNLTSITIPDSVTSIERSVFWNCKNLKNITLSNSITAIEGHTFHGCEKLTNIIIPNSVIKIGEKAFAGCYSLTSVTIPNSVTKIGERAFHGCRKLTNITIPNSVIEIGKDAFIFCNSLKNVSIENPKITKFIVPHIFGDSPSFKKIKIGNKEVYLY